MKRNLKKKSFQLEILSKLEGIPLEKMISAEPTKWLVVLNCSYDSMIDGLTLESLFRPFQGFLRVEMFLGAKPYSYVEFENETCAAAALDQLDGYKSDIVSKIVLLAFALELPQFPPRPITDSELISRVPGLALYEGFITGQEEADLIHSIIEQGKMGRWEILNKRSVQHYGYRFDYPDNDVDRTAIDQEMPKWCDDLLERYLERFPSQKRPNQLTMNRYQPGDGIAYHCDRHSSFDSPVLIFSLGSSIVMDFRSTNSQVVSAVLPPRSLLVIDGEARYGWEHVIRPRKVDLIDGKIVVRQDRWSLTFRNIRTNPCTCQYSQLCD
jgi:alkylated DNA repair protein alkB family protein 8